MDTCDKTKFGSLIYLLIAGRSCFFNQRKIQTSYVHELRLGDTRLSSLIVVKWLVFEWLIPGELAEEHLVDSLDN